MDQNLWGLKKLYFQKANDRWPIRYGQLLWICSSLFSYALLLSLHSCCIWFRSQVVLWLCWFINYPFGALWPSRSWQNGMGPSFKTYCEREYMNIKTVIHTTHERPILFIPGLCPSHCALCTGLCWYKCRSDMCKAVGTMVEVSLKPILCLSALENTVIMDSLSSPSPKFPNCSNKGSNSGAWG